MNRMRRIKHESGEVMIESLVVYLITFMLLFMVLALMMVTYQQFTIRTTAATAAVKIAHNIRFANVDIEDGTYSKDDFVAMKAYRYMFGNEDDLLENVKNKGEKYATARLMKVTFNGVVTEDNTDVSVTLESDGPALRHVTVTIKGEYKLPLDEMLDVFDLTINKFEAVESAECIDIIDYINYIDFSKNMVDTLYGDTGNIGKLVDKIFTMVNKFINYY